MSEPVLRPIPRAELTDEQVPLYESILDGRKSVTSRLSLTDENGALRGPFDPILRTPKVGEAISRLGMALRHDMSLPRRVNEAAILTVAARWSARFEWFAHVAIVRGAALISDADIAAIDEGTSPQDEEIALAWRSARGVLAGTRLPQPLVDEITAAWGEQGLVELCALCGHYSHLALLMGALGIEPPA